MAGGTDSSEHGEMMGYFRQLYTECERWAEDDPMAFRTWRSTYNDEIGTDVIKDPKGFIIISAVGFLGIVMALVVFQLGFLATLLLLFTFVGAFFVGTYAYVHARDKRALERGEDSSILSEWPGMIRLVRYPLSESWDRITQGLNETKVNYEPYGLVLEDVEGEPRGMVFDIPGRKLRLTVWQHWKVTGVTFIHLGPFIGIGRDRARMLTHGLDKYLSDRSDPFEADRLKYHRSQ
jgi:hypothetical protein